MTIERQRINFFYLIIGTHFWYWLRAPELIGFLQRFLLSFGRFLLHIEYLHRHLDVLYGNVARTGHLFLLPVVVMIFADRMSSFFLFLPSLPLFRAVAIRTGKLYDVSFLLTHVGNIISSIIQQLTQLMIITRHNYNVRRHGRDIDLLLCSITT